jgi:N-acetylglucosamine-6-sulfatase
MRLPRLEVGRFKAPRWSAVIAVLALVTGCGLMMNARHVKSGESALPQGYPSSRPNVVFVLTDDLSWNLLQYMPQVQKMQRDGMTFTNYTVADSLCCPSRATIFTGEYPHNTKVTTNTGPYGGFFEFHRRGLEQRTYAQAIQRGAGYRTAMLGKYLNGYEPFYRLGGRRAYVPPGWSEWSAAGNGYPGYGYHLATDGKVRYFGYASKDYLTDVLTERGTSFMQAAAKARTPFALELATFTPHGPFIPAPRDADAFPGLRAPRGPAWDRMPTHAPGWLRTLTPIGPFLTGVIDRAYRMRAQDVLSIDRMIGDIRLALREAGVAKNTYLVFSSDNGYHLGEYRLGPGKQTAFDTDVRVPLVVVGPGVPAGTTSDALTQNVDLAPTFDQIAGVRVPGDVDGHSMLGLWHGHSDRGWRNAVLIEHRGPDAVESDPDWQTPRSGDPPSYAALRTSTFTYVKYVNGEREYYDRVRDPYELDNTVGKIPKQRLDFLDRALDQYTQCHGGSSCWQAAHLTRTKP